MLLVFVSRLKVGEFSRLRKEVAGKRNIQKIPLVNI